MSAKNPQPVNTMRWLTEPRWVGHTPSPTVLCWLTASGWLTSHLRRQCTPDVRVEVLQGGPELTADFVTDKVRRVILWCDDTPCIYAETAIPDGTSQTHPWLNELGDEPLGQALEIRADVSRSEFEYALITPEMLPADLPRSATISSCWARRSVFSIGPDSLTVTEVFLPGIVAFEWQQL